MIIRIAYLSEHPNLIPTLAGWLVQEWEPWYGENGLGDAEFDLGECTQKDGLPLAVVALNSDNNVLGTAALKSQSAGHETAPGPWLAAVLVGEQFRRQGVGTSLVDSIEQEASRLGFEQLFTSTNAMSRLLVRKGWTEYGDTQTLRGKVKIYRRELVSA